MQQEIEYHHQLTLLCRSLSYSAESIIQLISITRFPCNHHCLPTEQPLPIVGRWAICPDNAYAKAIEQLNDADMPITGQSALAMEEDHEGEAEAACQTHSLKSDAQRTQIPTPLNQVTSDNGKPGFFPCKQCSEKQREHRMYLVGQLLDAVEAGKIDLWDSELAKKQRPPVNKTLPNIGDTLFSNDVIQWMSSGSLTNSDLIKFCREEKIRVVFEYDQPDNQAQIHDTTDVSVATPTSTQNTQQTAIDNQALSTDSQPDNQSQTSVKGPTATYSGLAMAFAVRSSEDTNLKWFRERCSNPGRYKAFQLALATPGKRGGEAARFYVLPIVAHLQKTEKINPRALRSGIQKCFPDALDLFDTYV